MATAVNKEEARKRLTPLQWHVTQEKGTERPFTGCYNKFYEKGTYTCIVCDQELFASDTKYDSGCGWPAFNEVLDQGRIKLTKDTSHGPCKNQTLLEIGQLPQTVLECRTVRIGSYKYIPREKVVISHAGVRFRVPLLENDGSFVTLDVNYNDIVKLLIHFGKTMPVLFFYMSTSAGVMIRELLGMEDPKGPYYDPAGKVGGNLLLLIANPDMVRTEVTCSNCDAHLGHVFNDGPKPARKRFCINSASISFHPAGEEKST